MVMAVFLTISATVVAYTAQNDQKQDPSTSSCLAVDLENACLSRYTSYGPSIPVSEKSSRTGRCRYFHTVLPITPFHRSLQDTFDMAGPATVFDPGKKLAAVAQIIAEA